MNEKFRRRVASSGLAQGGFAFFVATALTNVSNFVFHVVVSRLLGPSNYGALGALLNLVLVLSVPLGALQAAVTRAESARIHSEGQGIGLRTTLLRAFVAGVIATALFIALAPFVQSYLHLHTTVPVVLLAIWIIPAIIAAVAQGVLMGRFRFSIVASAMLVGGIVGRLVFGVVLVEAGLGLNGAVIASVLSQVVLSVIVLVPLFPEIVRSKSKMVGIGFRSGVHSIIALAGFWVLASEDTVLARHFLSAHAAGLYASASTAGRIALFLPAAISLVAFPRFARDKGEGELTRTTLKWSLFLTAVLGALSAVVLLSVPDLVVEILFGRSYLGAAPVVRILGIEAAGLGVINLLTYFHLARESLDSLLVWIGAALGFVGVEFIHSSPVAIAFVMVVSVALASAASLFSALNCIWRNPLIDDLDFVDKRLFEPVRDGELGCDLSIVVPYYNPGKALSTHIGDLVQVLDASGMKYEIIAVSDGSTDGSPDTLAGLYPSVLKCTSLPRNSGKGQALRVGLIQSSGRFLGFIDADGDIPAMELMGIIQVIRESNPDIITGSKRHPSSIVYYPFIRRVYSWGYQTLIKVVFHLPVTDTQTGLKVVRREVVKEVLPRMVEKRFAFDLEFFVVARHLGYRNIIEVPVVIKRRFTSTISVKAVRGMMIDTAGIFYRLKVLRFYDEVHNSSGEIVPATNSGGLEKVKNKIRGNEIDV